MCSLPVLYRLKHGQQQRHRLEGLYVHYEDNNQRSLSCRLNLINVYLFRFLKHLRDPSSYSFHFFSFFGCTRTRSVYHFHLTYLRYDRENLRPRRSEVLSAASFAALDTSWVHKILSARRPLISVSFLHKLYSLYILIRKMDDCFRPRLII